MLHQLTDPNAYAYQGRYQKIGVYVLLTSEVWMSWVGERTLRTEEALVSDVAAASSAELRDGQEGLLKLTWSDKTALASRIAGPEAIP